jgi:predicted nucleic acid-binding protein
MFILDTYVINELRKMEGLEGSEELERFAKSMPAQNMFVSAASLIDIANAINGTTSLVSRTLLEGWFYDHMLMAMRDQTLPVDADTIRFCREMDLGAAGVTTYAMIAAQAVLKGMTIVTRHPELYAFAGVSILNPWRAVDHPERERQIQEGIDDADNGRLKPLEDVAAKWRERSLANKSELVPGYGPSKPR